METLINANADARVKGLFVRNGKMVIDKVVNGVRIYKTLDTEDASLAQKVLEQLTHGILENAYLPKRKIPLTIGDVIDMFWKGHIMHKRYARNVRYTLDAVLERLGKYELHKISRANIDFYKRERFKDVRRNDPTGRHTVSSRTVQKELQYLSMAINFAVDNGEIGINPIKRFIHVPQGCPKKVVLDDGYENGPQWNAIYEAICDHIKPIALALYETGMRPKECFNMQWKWLHEKASERWVITIPKGIDKTGNEHDVPVSKRLLEMFKALKPRRASGDERIFPSVRRESGVRVNIDTPFHNALARCGLSKSGISPYALRRTRITIWDAVDSNACRYAVGHVARDVHLRHYVRISSERLFNLVGLNFKPILGMERA